MPATSTSYTQGITAVAENTISDRLSRKRTRHVHERFIEFLLLLSGAFSIAVTLGIVYVLVSESVRFF